MNETTSGYDIIPDLHADLSRLRRTLTELGYAEEAGVWRHPEGRRAAFLGDFIDPLAAPGPQSGPDREPAPDPSSGALAGTPIDTRGVLGLVRAMVEAGSAVAVMGNHELSALLFHTPGTNEDGITDGWMRARTPENIAPHEVFLRDYEGRDAERQEVLDWFLTLPLWLDLGGLRLVHACWDEASLAEVRARRPDGRLSREDLQEVALEGTPFARAVHRLLKGPEVPLPEGSSFRDALGHRRSGVRLKWWGGPAQTWRAAALSVPPHADLPEVPIPAELQAALYPATEPPVLVGHYELEGPPAAWAATNALCLDYPHAPCAYRWSGEAVLTRDNLLVIDGLERAIALAARAHHGQRDKAGAPYVLHPLRVMQACSPGVAQIVGVLHDVEEDTGWTFEQLRAEGFGEEVLEPLRLVTKLHEGEDYTAFIGRAAQHPVAREVKIADLKDNMDLSRIKEPTERDQERIRKYQRALKTLEGA